jgi:hypothetical protein
MIAKTSSWLKLAGLIIVYVRKIQEIEQRHENNMNAIREEMNHQFTQITPLIQQNPQLANIKPEVQSTNKTSMNN